MSIIHNHVCQSFFAMAKSNIFQYIPLLLQTPACGGLLFQYAKTGPAAAGPLFVRFSLRRDAPALGLPADARGGVHRAAGIQNDPPPGIGSGSQKPLCESAAFPSQVEPGPAFPPHLPTGRAWSSVQDRCQEEKQRTGGAALAIHSNYVK